MAGCLLLDPVKALDQSLELFLPQWQIERASRTLPSARPFEITTINQIYFKVFAEFADDNRQTRCIDIPFQA
jgi:hypothetical protein